MRLRFLIFFSAVLLALPAFAQQWVVSAPLSASAASCEPSTNVTACIFLVIDPKWNTVGVEVAGTYSGTLQFEGKVNATWVNVAASPQPSGSDVNSTTSTGTWLLKQVGGYSVIRVRCSTYSSGVATVSLNPSQAVIAGSGGGVGGAVTSVFTRTGDVVATSGDYSVGLVTGAAALASPTFTGVPAAPTPGTNINTTQIPTTAWVNTFYAPLASPSFTGTLTSAGNLSLTNATPSITSTSANAALSIIPNGTGPVVLGGSFAQVPVGVIGGAGLQFVGDTAGAGFYRNAATTYDITNGTVNMILLSNSFVKLRSSEAFAISSTTDANGAADVCWDRSAAGVWRADTDSACSDGTARLKAAGYISVGTKFASNAGCSETTLLGGATAGSFHAVSTSCTVIITLGNTATAPNGWACYAHDLTTSADYNNPHVSSTTTTATIVTGTIVSGDVIEFGCIGY
jgi:hypothetical protein